MEMGESPPSKECGSGGGPTSSRRSSSGGGARSLGGGRDGDDSEGEGGRRGDWGLVNVFSARIDSYPLGALSFLFQRHYGSRNF